MKPLEVEKIKQAFGNHYAPKIVPLLNRRKVFNQQGNPFSYGSIRKMVTGAQPNESVEFLILKLATSVMKKKAIEAAKREALTNQDY